MLCKLRCKGTKYEQGLKVVPKTIILDGSRMTKKDWILILSKSLNKRQVIDLSKLAAENKAAEQLIEMSFYPVNESAFRAAWVLENLFLLAKEDFMIAFKCFLDAYVNLKNRSCKRHFSKIMLEVLKDKHSAVWTQYDFEPVVETTFKWLIDPETPVAVQVNCMDVLFYLKERYSWIEEELKAQIVFLLKDGGAAMQSRGKRVFSKLSR